MQCQVGELELIADFLGVLHERELRHARALADVLVGMGVWSRLLSNTRARPSPTRGAAVQKKQRRSEQAISMNPTSFSGRQALGEKVGKREREGDGERRRHYFISCCWNEKKSRQE